MARQYKRDSRGRFASGGSTRSARPATRMVQRGKNRLTRDNAGRITSVGGSGATARGGRLRTASGKQRATQLARVKGTGGRIRKPLGGGSRISRAEPLMTGGTLAARSSLTRAKRKLAENPTPAQRGAVTRANKYAAAARARNTTAKKFGRPASVMRKRPPEMPLRWGVKEPTGVLTWTGQTTTMPRSSGKAPRIADTMREAMRALAQSDARFYRSLEKDFGIKIRVPKGRANAAAATSGARVKSAATGSRSVTQTLRAGLRELAQSDARRIREIQDITRGGGGGTLRGSGGASRRQIGGLCRWLARSR